MDVSSPDMHPEPLDSPSKDDEDIGEEEEEEERDEIKQQEEIRSEEEQEGISPPFSSSSSVHSSSSSKKSAASFTYTCSYGCGATFVSLPLLHEHEETLCPDHLWSCPCHAPPIPIPDRVNHLLSCPLFKSSWMHCFEKVVVALGKEICVERMEQVMRQTKKRADLAFCALCESGGSVTTASLKLQNEEYRKELRVVSDVCQLQDYVQVRVRKRREK